MSETVDLVVYSDLDELPRVIEFVRRSCHQARMTDDAIFACELATDEACTNIIEHAYAGRDDGEIQVSCQVIEDRFVIQFRDHGQPFDPNLIKTPDLTTELSQRPVGGLGLHFMRSLMDDVHFKFDHREGNTLIMVKRLSPDAGEAPQPAG